MGKREKFGGSYSKCSYSLVWSSSETCLSRGGMNKDHQLVLLTMKSKDEQTKQYPSLKQECFA